MPRAPYLMILALGLSFASVHADDTPSPAARLKAAQKEVANAKAAVRETAMKEGKLEVKLENLVPLLFAGKKIYQVSTDLEKKQKAGIAVALEIAKSEPTSDVGFEALEWLMLNDIALYTIPPGKAALDLMIEHHAANPKTGKAIAALASSPPYDEKFPTYSETVNLFNAVLERNPNRTVRGQAALGLALLAKQKFGHAAYKGFPSAPGLCHAS